MQCARSIRTTPAISATTRPISIARAISHDAYEQLASHEGALFVGSPQQIVDKILYGCRLFRHQRFMAQIDIGGLPYAKVAEVIELLATQVAPVVQRELAG